MWLELKLIDLYCTIQTPKRNKNCFWILQNVTCWTSKNSIMIYECFQTGNKTKISFYKIFHVFSLLFTVIINERFYPREIYLYVRSFWFLFVIIRFLTWHYFFYSLKKNYTYLWYKYLKIWKSIAIFIFFYL